MLVSPRGILSSSSALFSLNRVFYFSYVFGPVSNFANSILSAFGAFTVRLLDPHNLTPLIIDTGCCNDRQDWQTS